MLNPVCWWCDGESGLDWFDWPDVLCCHLGKLFLSVCGEGPLITQFATGVEPYPAPESNQTLKSNNGCGTPSSTGRRWCWIDPIQRMALLFMFTICDVEVFNVDFNKINKKSLQVIALERGVGVSGCDAELDQSGMFWPCGQYVRLSRPNWVGKYEGNQLSSTSRNLNDLRGVKKWIRYSFTVVTLLVCHGWRGVCVSESVIKSNYFDE